MRKCFFRPMLTSAAHCLFTIPQTAIRCTSHLIGQKKTDLLSKFGLLHGWGWIRTTEAICSRFTVCPLWPLGNPSIYKTTYVVVTLYLYITYPLKLQEIFLNLLSFQQNFFFIDMLNHHCGSFGHGNANTAILHRILHGCGIIAALSGNDQTL